MLKNAKNFEVITKQAEQEIAGWLHKRLVFVAGSTTDRVLADVASGEWRAPPPVSVELPVRLVDDLLESFRDGSIPAPPFKAFREIFLDALDAQGYGVESVQPTGNTQRASFELSHAQLSGVEAALSEALHSRRFKETRPGYYKVVEAFHSDVLLSLLEMK